MLGRAAWYGEEGLRCIVWAVHVKRDRVCRRGSVRCSIEEVKVALSSERGRKYSVFALKGRNGAASRVLIVETSKSVVVFAYGEMPRRWRSMMRGVFSTKRGRAVVKFCSSVGYGDWY